MGANVEEIRVAEEIRALLPLNIDGLRAEWRRRFTTPPPPMRAPELFRRVLAERIQTETFGRDIELERKLAVLVRAHLRGVRPTGPRPSFRPGAILTREYEGRVHGVEVQRDGFVWEGRRFASLSSVARAITGVRWNGPRFFGLRDEVRR